MSSGNIVVEWLRSLRLGHYADGFIDNGYDDLEICKQVGDPDLDAIGVFNPVHRDRLLTSVRTLREEGAASVYFSLEDAANIREECQSAAGDGYADDDADEVADGIDHRVVDVIINHREQHVAADKSNQVAAAEDVVGTTNANVVAVAGGGGSGAKYFDDEYEERKTELVRMPKVQLKRLLSDKLASDGIRLSCHPYSTKDGDCGYLEGLASRYADLFNTHYCDVLKHLENLRQAQLTEISTVEVSVITSDTPPKSCSPVHNITFPVTNGITSSQSQPIYVPGKYSPSSCLDNKEEDEIYGYGYGVFGSHIARQQQQQKLIETTSSNYYQPLLYPRQQNYQTCLSPRSAYFYEFPPSESTTYTNANKKKTTFSRFLRGLKTSHRKEKHGASSPRHGRASMRGVPQRVDTPDSVLKSGLGISDGDQNAFLRSMIDPHDYDRLRRLQLNEAASNSFEETIYRLKLQDALRKREKFTKEHNEILKDIKHGLLQLSRERIKGPQSDGDVSSGGKGSRVLPNQINNIHLGRSHWYDEPPYESDPEDFLMSNTPGGVPGIIASNGQNDVNPTGENISQSKVCGHQRGRQRGLILPQAGHPPTLIPLREHHESIENEMELLETDDDNMRKIKSRLWGSSVDDDESTHHSYYSRREGKIRHFLPSKFNRAGSEDVLSPSHSSDYEDSDELNHLPQHIPSKYMFSDVKPSSNNASSSVGLVDKVKNLKHDVRKKLCQFKSELECCNSQANCPCSTSSIDSLPSGSGSSTQALIHASSNHSSLSTEETDHSSTEQTTTTKYSKPTYNYKSNISYSKDRQPTYEQDDDIINISTLNVSGHWKNGSNNISDRKSRHSGMTAKYSTLPKNSNDVMKTIGIQQQHTINVDEQSMSLEAFLQTAGLDGYISLFKMNGYENLQRFKRIEFSDLVYLGIKQSDDRSRILSAVQWLHDFELCGENEHVSSCDDEDNQMKKKKNVIISKASNHHQSVAMKQHHLLRDSGCYESSTTTTTLKANRQQVISSSSIKNDGVEENNRKSSEVLNDESSTLNCDEDSNSLDSVVKQCNDEILARLQLAQNKNNKNTEIHSEDFPDYHHQQCHQAIINNSKNLLPMPSSGGNINNKSRAKDSYVSARGQTMLVDPCRKHVITRLRACEEACETNHKLMNNAVKYVVGGGCEIALNDSNNYSSIFNKCCLSEKSSDSGISNSSLSSMIVREPRHNPHDTKPSISGT